MTRHVMAVLLPLCMCMTLHEAAASQGDCGGVLPTGECNGNVLQWCDNIGTDTERLQQDDCGTDVFPMGTVGVCALIEQGYGYDCAVPSGGGCQFRNGAGDLVHAFCEGVAPACVTNEQTQTSS